MLWFRMLDVAVKASAFAFGTLLALYLLGSAAGCLAVAVRGIRFARPLRDLPALPVPAARLARRSR